MSTFVYFYFSPNLIAVRKTFPALLAFLWYYDQGCTGYTSVFRRSSLLYCAFAIFFVLCVVLASVYDAAFRH